MSRGGQETQEELELLRKHVAQLEEELGKERAEKRQMSEEFYTQLKSVEKHHDDVIQDLKRAHSRESQELTEKVRANLSQVGKRCLLV